MDKCRICGSSNLDPPIELREVMFGTNDTFTYQRCHECGCLQIMAQPENMAQFYPDYYYSFSSESSSLKQKLKVRIRDLLSLYGPGWLFGGRNWWEFSTLKSLRGLGVSRSMRILDLGCGSGSFIVRLADLGFKRVLGATHLLQNPSPIRMEPAF